jgi:hypothetical protein
LNIDFNLLLQRFDLHREVQLDLGIVAVPDIFKSLSLKVIPGIAF